MNKQYASLVEYEEDLVTYLIKERGWPILKSTSKVSALRLELDKLYIKGTSIEDAFYELFTGSGQDTRSFKTFEEYAEAFKCKLVKRYNWSVTAAFQFEAQKVLEAYEKGLSLEEAYFKVFAKVQDLISG